MLETLFRGCMQYLIVRKKQTVDPPAFNALFDSAVTIYAIHVGYKEEWWHDSTHPYRSSNPEE